MNPRKNLPKTLHKLGYENILVTFTILEEKDGKKTKGVVI